MEDRYEAARNVARRLITGDAWEPAIDDDVPPELRELFVGVLDTYRRGDLEWLLEHADPEIEIVQVPEIPDRQTYRGHQGFIDAILDWPRQWEDFHIAPRAIFAVGDDQLIIDAIHSGRPHSMDIRVETEIVFATRWRDGRLANWDMFLTVEEALGRAAERGAHAGDDRAAQGDRRE